MKSTSTSTTVKSPTTVLYGQATTIFHSNFSFERVLKSSFAIDKLGPCLVVGPGRRDHRGSL